MIEKEFELYLQTTRILIALAARNHADNPWTASDTYTFILPERIEAPSKTTAGRIWQKFRKACGKLHILNNGDISPAKLGKDMTEIFDSFCSPDTYNIAPAEEVRIITRCWRKKAGNYRCHIRVYHKEQELCQVQLGLSVSRGLARLRVFAPLMLLARLIVTKTARPIVR